MSSGAGNSDEKLQMAIRPFCMVYHVPFRRLLESVDQSGEDARESVHDVIFNELYNSRPIAEL